MNVTKACRPDARRMALAAAGVALCLTATRAGAATYLFDTDGTTPGFGVTNGGTYNWDDANWTTDTAGTTAGVTWPAGNFPKFNAATGASYTVNVASVESVAGFQQSTASITLTVVGTGSGALDMASGTQGIFNGTSGVLNFNVPISGAATLQFSGGGNIFLNRPNTYSAGTNSVSTATLLHFNNGSAFGTGRISLNIAGYTPLLASGASAITLANNFTNAIAGGGVNFGSDANTPVTSTGNWTLAAFNLILRNNGGTTSPLTLTGVISGTAGLSVSANSTGLITFSGANTYTGSTTVGVTGSTAVTLKLGAPNTIATTSSLILAGGVLDPGGFTHTMTSSTLGLTANSTINFVSGAGELDFANSAAVGWTAGTTLRVTNWDPTIDRIRFGTDNTGLTTGQLAQIRLNGTNLATASLDAQGYLVPEPSTGLALLAGGSLLAAGRRRRAR